MDLSIYVVHDFFFLSNMRSIAIHLYKWCRDSFVLYNSYFSMYKLIYIGRL